MQEFLPRKSAARSGNKGGRIPLSGYLELTYRCNLRCVHCYARGSEKSGRELSTVEWKRIIEGLHKSGCLSLCFTGGEPLIRADFWALYTFAKNKGFLVSIYTNGILLNDHDLERLSSLPPNLIEITLNGITKSTYDSITQVAGSFERAVAVIKRIKELRLPLVLKANCLRQNREELGKIKDFALKLLWRSPRKTYPFKYDPFIYPRLNGDTSPCRYRLNPKDIIELWKKEPLVWEETKRFLSHSKGEAVPKKNALYLCNTWENGFFINPFGRLKFCLFTDAFSVDLRKTTFENGFFNVFPRIRKSRFTTRSRCRSCRLRSFCCRCPADAKLEAGNAEEPIGYFCKLARMTKMEIARPPKE